MPAMTDFVSAPESLLAPLPGFEYEPRFETIDGLRIARVEEGDGPPVVFVHGEPTWSYLWRKLLPPVIAAGHRVIVPDLPGFGRSDKPTAVDWYTYDRHAAIFSALLERLEVSGATLVVHDWGGPIGLRAAVEAPERFARIVVLDTGLFTGHQKMADAWIAFRDFVARTEDLPVGFLVRGACHTDPGEQVIAAYEAPFPTPASKAGARAFPLILPTAPDAPGAAAGQRTLDALRADRRPKLFMWADSDPVLPLETGRRFAAALGGELDHVIEAAGHFLQEDAGERIGERIADWLACGA
jgi:haloalkane dehalogenase